MNGNITKEGIAKDLDWMQRVGIGGVQNFDANLGTPPVVDKRLVYMHPEWKDAFKYAVDLADQKGIEFAIAASPGWSETGGPWVQPQDGIKKLVWSTTEVAAGKREPIKLAAPPSLTGPFQTIRYHEELAGLGEKLPPPPEYYRDVAVLAFPVAAAQAASARVTAGNGDALDVAALGDDDLETTVSLKRGTTKAPASIGFQFDAPRAIRSASLYVPGAWSMFSGVEWLPVLEARAGSGWRRIVELPLTAVPTTVSFAPVEAREFRVVFAPNAAPHVGIGEGVPGVVTLDIFPKAPPDSPIRIGELRLSAQPRIDRFEAKAGFSVARDYYAFPVVSDNAVGVAPKDVVDVTSRLKPDGTLDWQPQRGSWRILRLGYSLTGTTNHPATPEATGLEVDKLDGAAVRNYLQTYLGMYREKVGGDLLGRKGLNALLTDSIETGAANWTPRLVERFKALRGYDPTPWLPTLTGTIVGSRAQSDAFLYDFRRTLSDLLASEHYATVAAVAHDNGLKVYGEALEDVRPMLGDDIAMRWYADIPMAALWSYPRGGAPRPTLLGDMKGASSVAHLRGVPFVAAESLTAFNSPWAFAPADLRRMVDLEFANGITRPVIHTSVHQPVDDKLPGLSLAIFGQYFNRHETWAEMARPWVDYLSRTSYLLQQGRNIADVAYFIGEERPITALFADAPLADVPVRYAYDFVDAGALLHDLKVIDGELASKGGARYRALYLGGTSERMTLPVLERLAQLAEAGATIIGTAPQSSPSLNDDPAAFSALVARLWSGSSATIIVGKGRVIARDHVEDALASAGVRPDFDYAKPAADSELLFVHRKLTDGDAYFVTNRRNRAETIEARFRVNGKAPELWHADTGRSEPVSYRIEGDSTIVTLPLEAEDSFFVVFRKPVATPSAVVPRSAPRELDTLTKPWTVAFQPGRGAPASTTVDALHPLNEDKDPGVRYFSGIATYTTMFTLPAGAKPGAPLWLDLGQVGDVAEVRVNGTDVGTTWKPPYRIDIGPAVKRSENRLEVRVANLWVNRLIGDAQPGVQNKVTWTALPTYRPDAPLRASGLIGPVRLLGMER
jgi:hypothetical protein